MRGEGRKLRYPRSTFALGPSPQGITGTEENSEAARVGFPRSTPCHPERSDCFANAKQPRSRRIPAVCNAPAAMGIQEGWLIIARARNSETSKAATQGLADK